MTEQMPEYHFVITAQKPMPGGGTLMADWSGRITPEPDWTRQDTFQELRGLFAQRYPQLDQACVTFFSLEPNQL